MHDWSAPRQALALLAAAFLLAAAGAASAEGINPNPVTPGNGTPIPGIDKTPANLCRPGSARLVSTTRKLSLPPVRYCTDATWNVRDVRVVGADLLWRVPFADGQVDCACAYAGTTTTPPSTGDAPAPPAAGSSDRITAGIAMRELRAMGYQATLDADSRGVPRITVNVDGYRWGIGFYTCDNGPQLEDRRCGSLQFYSGYTMNAPVSTVTMNKWNTEKRFARGYTFTNSDGKPTAQVEIDVYYINSGADPGRMFRGYFSIMKIQAADFRKLINFN
jgi:hypothetical protein